ncbi:MAG: NAD-dependent epimerase/dehydratase family protein [Planctomycetota bacterium]
MNQVLVTGGCGFIGSHLVRALLARGDRVRVLDDLSSGKRENLAGVEQDVELVVADLADPAVAPRACAGIDLVFHQGAVPAVPRSIADPAGTFRVNVVGTHALLLAARAAGVRRFVLASSSSVYGPTAELPKHEEMPPFPVSPYAAQKLAAEQLALAASRSLGIPAVALRYFNVYGPRQDPRGGYAAVIPAFASRLLRGEAPTINGDGSYSRDFSFVEDVVRANLAAGEEQAAVGHAINVAGGRRITILELYQRIAAAVGREDLAPVLGETREGDIPHSLASIERARRLLGWTPQVSLEEGLRRTVESYAAGS